MKRHFATPVFLLAFSAFVWAQSQQYPSAKPAQVQSNHPAQNTNTVALPNASGVPETVYLPSGLDVQVRVNESLNSATAQAGDTFTGTLVNSIEDDNNNIIFERGTPVSGRIVSAKPSGRLSDSGQLVLSLNNIRSERQVANVTTITKTVTGASHAASNAEKVGGGALLGAIIGGLAGGGRGAAIGAGVGAGAGAGTAAATGKKEAKVDAESIVHFVTTTETTVVPVGSEAAQKIESQPNVYNGTGPRDDNAPVLRRRNRDTDSEVDSNSNVPQANTQTAKNYPSNNYPSDNDAPVLRRREGSDSDVSAGGQQQDPNSQPKQGTQASNMPPDMGATNNAPSGAPDASSAPQQWGFSARDKRVINSCLADNPGSVPAADANAIPYYKGDTLPYAAQKKIRSLPLACERQLSAVAADQERVIYNQQVLLVNSNSLVLDAFDIPK